MIPVLYVPPGAEAWGSASEAHSLAPVARIPGRDVSSDSSDVSSGGGDSSPAVGPGAGSVAFLARFRTPPRPDGTLSSGGPADGSTGVDVGSPPPGPDTLTSSRFVIWDPLVSGNRTRRRRQA